MEDGNASCVAVPTTTCHPIAVFLSDRQMESIVVAKSLVFALHLINKENVCDEIFITFADAI